MNKKTWLGICLASLMFAPIAHAQRKPVYYSGRTLMEINNYKIIDSVKYTTSDPKDVNSCVSTCSVRTINQGGNSVDRDRPKQREITNYFLIPFFMKEVH